MSEKEFQELKTLMLRTLDTVQQLHVKVDRLEERVTSLEERMTEVERSQKKFEAKVEKRFDMLTIEFEACMDAMNMLRRYKVDKEALAKATK